MVFAHGAKSTNYPTLRVSKKHPPLKEPAREPSLNDQLSSPRLQARSDIHPQTMSTNKLRQIPQDVIQEIRSLAMKAILEDSAFMSLLKRKRSATPEEVPEAKKPRPNEKSGLDVLEDIFRDLFERVKDVKAAGTPKPSSKATAKLSAWVGYPSVYLLFFGKAEVDAVLRRLVKPRVIC